MDFYLAAIGVGVALGVAWVGWLLFVRSYLRRTKSQPGALLSVLQVIVVLLLMLAAYHVSDYCLTRLGADTPEGVRLFRRVWLLIWAVAMVASIHIFLDIRKMAAPANPPARRQIKRPPMRGSR